MQAEEQERQRARDAWIDRLENSEPSHLDSRAEHQQSSPPMSPTQQRSRVVLPDRPLQNESSMTHLHNARVPAAASDGRGPREAGQGLQYSAQPNLGLEASEAMSPGRLAAMQTAAGEQSAAT